MRARRPEIFISATTADLRSTRQAAKEALLTLGCVPVEQTNFPPDYRTVREMLRAKIAGCDALIHIVGECCGAEPVQRGPDQPRRSYTQLEYDLARELQKPIHTFLCSDNFPYDAHEPESPEKQTLQQAHRAAIASSDQIYTPVKDLRELSLRIRELETRFVHLQQEIQQTRSWLAWAIGAAVLVVALLVVFVIRSNYQARTSDQKSQARLEDRIFGLEKLLQTQLQQASGAKAAPAPLDFPRALREWAGQHHITPEQAQREVESWIADIRQRSTDLSERARAEFLAQHFSEAARLSDQAAEDKFARSRAINIEASALQVKSRKLIEEAVVDLTRAGEALLAQQDYAEALARFLKALENVPREYSPSSWAYLHLWCGVCHKGLATSVEPKLSRQHLDLAVAAYHKALEVFTPEAYPQFWAGTKNNLGLVLNAQAGYSQGSDTARLLGEAVRVFRDALQIITKETSPELWATIQNNLGTALHFQVRQNQGPDAKRLLGEAVMAYRAALEVRTRQALPKEWADTQNNMGIALSDQAYQSQGLDASRLRSEAAAAYRSVLEIFTRDALPQDWARTQNNLGIVLREQAEKNQGSEAVPLLKEAVTASRAALEVYTREALPQSWALTQNNLAECLRAQAGQSQGSEAASLLVDAVTTYHAVLEVYTRDTQPQDWARIQNNLGIVLRALAWQTRGGEKQVLLMKAITAFRSALEIWTKEHFPRYHEMASQNLAQAEAALKNLP